MCQATRDRGATLREMVSRYEKVCQERERVSSRLQVAAGDAVAEFIALEEPILDAAQIVAIAEAVLLALIALISTVPGLGRLLGRITRIFAGRTAARLAASRAILNARSSSAKAVRERLQRALADELT